MFKGVVKGKYAKVLDNLKSELILRNLSSQTAKAYLYNNNKFLEFIDKSPKNVSKNDIRNYLLYLATDKGVKPNTFNIILNSLRFYYIEVLKKRFKFDFKKAKIEKRVPVVISREDIKKMIDLTSNLKHKIIIEMMYCSGLRVSECLSIMIDDLNLEQKYGLVRKGKGSKDRYFILAEIVIDDIKKFISLRKDKNPYLFIDHQGHLSVRTAQEVVKQAARKAKIKQRVFCHALRSSFATHLLENGASIDKIQRLLGHQSMDTTMMYIRSASVFVKDVESPLDNSFFLK